ncbi:winged helix DNA-binding domain-containing protein [Demequina globuliformis]|uniref:winged helix DNA-binding domain-containing protein n=1 Tax=Demequina globuliformis TaxID=676202 RepID=UPI00078027D3|nr:winged helix DNA-binding domain-containing protein [Demequina globuliformis]
MLTRHDIRRLRLHALGLSIASMTSVEEVVTWHGALQAQDNASGLWSLGRRLAQGADAAAAGQVARERVAEGFAARHAVRTWPMRGTLHLVPARDARWMLELMGAKPLAGAARRREYLGLTEVDAERAVEVLRETLTGRELSRAACVEALVEAGLPAHGQSSYHLLWFAAQRGVTCVPARMDGEQTFALLDEWAPDQVSMDRDEALATIALRYVRSHGPVSIKDCARWTGLGVRDCRAGIAAAGAVLREVTTDDGPMYVASDSLEASDTDAVRAAIPPPPEWDVLPGFDEYMLGYGDRSAMVSAADFARVVPGNNGVFRATVVRRGEVVGTWTTSKRARNMVVSVEPLRRLGARDRRDAEHAFTVYGTFVGRPLEVRWG